MMPPNCCLCDRGIDSGDVCELVCFQRTPEQQAWHAEADSRSFSDHPPDCEWFCEDHVRTARSYRKLDCAKAVEAIRREESWTVMQMDLFDRETASSASQSGTGFESGLVAFWKEILATVHAEGSRSPMTYYLRIGKEAPGYTVERWTDGFLRLQQYLETSVDPNAVIHRIANAQAEQFRHGTRSQADRWLTDFCQQLPDLKGPSNQHADS